jgi:NPCBM/NEW2 domain-containing protein
VDLGPASTRVLTLMPAGDQVQLISTSRHITQGWLDLISHHLQGNRYSGKSKLIRNDPYSLRFAFPPGKNFSIKSASAGGLPVRIFNHQGWAEVEITSPKTTEVNWEVLFEPAPAYHFPVKEPQRLWAERLGVDGANLRWVIPAQPTFAYQVSLNGKLLGYTTSQSFALRGLDPNVSYTAEVRSVWKDDTLSEKKASFAFTLKKILPPEMFLSDLDPVRLTPGWRQPELRQFEKGISMPTNSEIEFELNGTYDKFAALVGIDNELNNNDAQVEFVVLGDGKELWKSDGARAFQVEVKNVKRLTLRVRRVGEGGRVYANWVDARLTR